MRRSNRLLFTAACCCLMINGCGGIKEGEEKKLFAEGLSSSAGHFDSIDEEETDETYMTQGKVRVSGEEAIFYIQPIADMEVSVTCELTEEKGESAIYYRAPDGARTLLAQCGKVGDRVCGERMPLKLLSGLGSIDVKGKLAVCDFKVTLENLDKDKLEYLDIYSPK